MYPLPWRDQLDRAAVLQSLPPMFVAAVIRQVSEFNPAAVSRAGARVLMQIMPATGAILARRTGVPGRVGASALHAPELNIRLGTLYLRTLVDSFEGGLERALAGYNGGPSRARQWLGWAQFDDPEEFIETIPFTETREYVIVVLRNAEIYQKLYDPSGAAETRSAGSTD